MELENLEVYNLSIEISQKIWEQVKKWPNFEKETTGKQLVRSADSITANISEGFGRYHFKEYKNFLFIARGSLYETKSWLHKAVDRDLIDSEESAELNFKLTKLAVKINNLINVIGKKAET